MLNKKKFIALIPARGGSKGIKLKNVRNLCGKPLVCHTIEFAKNLKFVDKVILSSDNKKILKIGEKNKIISLKRPKDLSGDRISDFKLILNILKFLKSQKDNFDYVLYLQPTSPFRKLNDIKKACKVIIDKRYDTIWSINKVSDKYHPLKLFEKKGKFFTLFDIKGKNIIARQQLNNIYQRNGIFYIFDVKKLLKSKSIYPKKGVFPFLINYKFINIDTLADLKLSQKLFQNWEF